MWYLRRVVVLTKDNLTRRNWHERKKCWFCTHDETIKHLFFQCKFAHSTWSVIQTAFNLYPPTSVANIYGHWLDGIPNRFTTLIELGRLSYYGHFGSVGMIWYLMQEHFSPAGYFLLYTLAPYVDDATPNRVPTSVQGGVYTVGASGQRGFYETWVAAQSSDRSTSSFDIGIVSVLYDFTDADLSF